MKTFICILLTLTFGFTYAQKKNKSRKNEYFYEKMTCQEGINEAKKDAQKKIYTCLSYGYPSRDTNWELEKFVDEYRKKKYGIITGMGGCMVSDYTRCYARTIEKIVLKKFGKDIFEKSWKEAEKLYPKKETPIIQNKPIIRSSDEDIEKIFKSIFENVLSYKNLKKFFCEDMMPEIHLKNGLIVSLKEFDEQIRGKNIKIPIVKLINRNDDSCIVRVDVNYPN